MIGSETSGGMRNVMVRNVTFVETNIGLRFKSARGRGGVVEKIHVRDVAMRDIATGAVVFETSYGGAAPGEESAGSAPRPVSGDSIPHFRTSRSRTSRATGPARR